VPAVVELFLACSIGVWFVLELRQAFNHRHGGRQADRGSLIVVRLTAAAGFIAAVGVAKAAPAAAIHPADVAAWTGLAVLWCGIAVRVWCFRTLGRYFTFTVQTSSDQPIITTGPYRVLRHPAYAGLLLAFIGIAILTTPNWLSLLVLIPVVLVGLIYRIRVEERVLMHDLGDTYGSYAATHKRLVPGIW
jgi:protein-S-isoprenylcysteine O-methyltransferase Ste14